MSLVKIVGLLVNPAAPETAYIVADARKAGSTVDQQLVVGDATSPSEIDAAFASFASKGVHAVVVGGDPFLAARHKQIVTTAAQQHVPTVYSTREFVVEGGLMSYGNDIADAYRQAGLYIARILKGEKPADLPVVQSIKFELVINLKTARALGIALPSGILAIADEVIE